MNIGIESLYLIVSACFLTFIFCYILSIISPKIKLLDYPNNRKIHSSPVPLVGGISIALSFLIISFFLNLDLDLKFIIYSSIVVLVFGLVDDIFDIGIIIRLIAQFISCLIIIGAGLKILNFGEYVLLPYFELGYLSILITVVCVIGLTNAFNFIDGSDGFCVSQLIISLISILFFSQFSLINENIVNLILVLIFSLFISFVFNLGAFPKIKIFLGDSGSTTMGFLVAWFLIYFSSKGLMHESLTIWAVTLPVFDMFRVIFERMLKKRNPFKPDKSHIHHLMLYKGYQNTKILSITILYSLISSLLGIIIFNFLGPDFNIIFYLLWFIIYLSVINIFLKNNFYIEKKL